MKRGKNVYNQDDHPNQKVPTHTHTRPGAACSIEKNIETPHLAPTKRKKENLLDKKRAEGERETHTQKPFKRFLRSLQSSPRGDSTHVQGIESSPERWSNQQRKKKGGQVQTDTPNQRFFRTNRRTPPPA